MLRLRLSIAAEAADDALAALGRIDGVRRLVRRPDEAVADEIAIAADVEPVAADAVIEVVRRLRLGPDDYVLTREDVIAPGAIGRTGDPRGFAWVELMGQARANARPIARYLALMAAAAVVASLGVITENAILIVGAMAVSPDLMPICASCVGIAGRRLRLAGGAFATLAVGLGLVIVVAAALTAALDLTGLLPPGYRISDQGLGTLASIDYSTVIVALAAGVAAMLAFETRASATVGVAISVTTIPASAYLGVAIGVGEAGTAGGALAVLAVNVTLLILSGTITLAVQRFASTRSVAPSRSGEA